METIVFYFPPVDEKRFRPDLRGWKLKRLAAEHDRCQVPTRLEGMETAETHIWRADDDWFRPDLRGWKPSEMTMDTDGLLVPTRLEGMETIPQQVHKLHHKPVPTRLEGMETEIAHHLIYTRCAFRPDLRGWKPANNAPSHPSSSTFRPDLRGWKHKCRDSNFVPRLCSDPT